jgi:glycerophosphoryl diester phosphodiesterase
MKGLKETFQLLLIVIVIVFCHAMKPGPGPQTRTVKANLPAFDKEAHRGGRGLMPENTIPAMLNAIKLGVNTLEMDAVITKDKKVILSHEPFFNHAITTKPDGDTVSTKEERSLNIFEMTYDETQRYDVGSKPNPGFPQQQRYKAAKPLLSAVIDSAEAYVKQHKATPVFYNIETKCQPTTDNKYHPAPDEFLDLLMAVLKAKKITDPVIIHSIDFSTLQIIHKKYPAIMTAALVGDKKTLDQQLESLGFIPTIYSPVHQLVTPELIEQCHQKKIRILPWTVNDKATIDKLKAMGVDGIISDYPNLF